jgi:UDP-3-O-[3-hydroxymyristoyl] glucosamine N-acyltransferase
MAIRLKDLAAQIGATVQAGDPEKMIDGVANLAEAGPGKLAPLTDPAYAHLIEKTQAAAIVTKTETQLPTLPAGAALLWSADPEMSFVQAIRVLNPERTEKPGIDARAAVEAGVELGADVYVGPYAVIRKGAKIGARASIMAHAVIGCDCVIGDDSRVYPHAVLYDGVKIGKRVYVHAGTILGADGFGYKFRNGKHVKVPQVGIVEIGDDVEIGANTCIDRGALNPTRVGAGTKIDNLVQIGHGVSIGKHCILCGQAALAGSSGMDDYAMIGGNVGIADHVFMGKGSKAGAKSGIGKDVPPGKEVFGLIAEERGVAFRQIAAMRRLPEMLKRVRDLEKKLEELSKNKTQ